MPGGGVWRAAVGSGHGASQESQAPAANHNVGRAGAEVAGRRRLERGIARCGLPLFARRQYSRARASSCFVRWVQRVRGRPGGRPRDVPAPWKRVPFALDRYAWVPVFPCPAERRDAARLGPFLFQFEQFLAFLKTPWRRRFTARRNAALYVVAGGVDGHNI